MYTIITFKDSVVTHSARWHQSSRDQQNKKPYEKKGLKRGKRRNFMYVLSIRNYEKHST